MDNSKKLTVVHIITKLELGGAQKVCLNLVNGLAKKEVNTYLISGATGTIAHHTKTMPNIFLLPSFKREIALSSVWLEIKNVFSIIRILHQLKKKHPHIIVHTHSTKAGLVGRWAAFFAGIPTRIHTIHGYGFNPYQARIVRTIIIALEWITSLITTQFICVSSQDVKTGIALFPRFKQKHTIIRAAIDWQQFYTPAQITSWPNQDKRPFVFGTVSSFTQPGKNIPELLKAFLAVAQNHPDIRLEILGGGILQREAEAWVAQHPEIHDKVLFWGWQETIAPIMKQWHTFVFSSLWEGLPCAVVEARMLKLPVISYQTGGIHDVISHGTNGFLYKQKDWQSLASGMQQMITNKELYQKFRTYEDDLTSFDNINMVEEHHKLYKSQLQ